MIPILFEEGTTEFTSNGIGRLSDCISCKVTEKQSGIYECKFQYPMSGIHYKDITERRIIYCIHDDTKTEQPFEIYGRTAPIKGVVTFFAHHVSYRLGNVVLDPFTASTCAEAMSRIKENEVNESPFVFWTDKVSVGEFEVKVPTVARYILGGVEGSILDAFNGGDYEWDGYTVKLWNDRGQDNNVNIRYGVNLLDLTQETDDSEVFNAVAPFWAHESMGEGDQDVLVTLPEKIVRAEGTSSEPLKPVTLDLSERFSNQPSEAQLRAYANKYLTDNRTYVLKQNLRVDFVALWQTTEYENVAPLQRVRIYDYVHVIHDELGVNAKLQVVETSYNVLTERYDSMELGKAKKSFAQIIAGEAENAIKQEVPTKSYVEQAVSAASAVIKGNRGGYKLEITDSDGHPMETLYMDAPTVEQAVNILRIGQSGIAFSNHGYDPESFVSAWTIDGQFVADFITAGTLNANLLRAGIITDGRGENYWNLETGELYLMGGSVHIIPGDPLDTAIKETSGTTTRTILDNANAYGLGWRVNASTFTNNNNGECYYHGYSTDGTAADVNGWVVWKGAKVTIPKGCSINPGDTMPYDKVLYSVWRTSDSKFHDVVFNDSTGAWEGNTYTGTTPSSRAAWTWNEDTDIVLASYLIPAVEGAIYGAQLFTPPKKYSELPEKAMEVAHADALALTNALDTRVSELEAQIDGQIEIYYKEYAPKPNENDPDFAHANVPANAWTTAQLKADHVGDLFYDLNTGYSYRWVEKPENSGKYLWLEIQDSAATQALAMARDAKAVADGKRRVFYPTQQHPTPYPPYDEGDIWMQGENGDILVCTTAKAEGATFSATDFQKLNKYTDESTVTSMITEQMSTIEVGGRNMLWNTNSPRFGSEAGNGNTYFSDVATLQANGAGTEWVELPDSPVDEIKYGAKFVCTATGGGPHFVGFYQYAATNNLDTKAKLPYAIKWKKGQTYTASFWAKSDTVGAIVKCSVADQSINTRPNLGGVSFTIDEENKWKRYTTTFEWIGEDINGKNFYMGFTFNIVATVWMCGFQLETGNVATDWSEFPRTLISYGGRNLIRNTNDKMSGLIDFSDVSKLPNINGYYNDGQHYGNVEFSAGTREYVEHGVKVTVTSATAPYIRFGTATGNATYQERAKGRYGLEAGETYTLSFDYEAKMYSGTGMGATSSYYLAAYLRDDSMADGGTGWTYSCAKYIDVFEYWDRSRVVSGHGIFTFIVPENVTRLFFDVRPNDITSGYFAAGDYLALRNIKLEKGNHASDWTPAPEDIDKNIADTKASIPGRNYLIGTGTPAHRYRENKANLVTGYLYSMYNMQSFRDLGMIAGDKVTISFDWECNPKNLTNRYTHQETLPKTMNGVTFADGGDGSITANGTSTNWATYWVVTQQYPLTLPAGKYLLTGCPSGGGNNKWRVGVANTSLATIFQDDGSGNEYTFTEETQVTLYVQVYNGNTVSGLTFTPRLVQIDALGTFRLENYGVKNGVQITWLSNLPNIALTAGSLKGHFEYTYALNETTLNTNTIYARVDNTIGEIVFSNMKYERGDVPTPWIPAAEDAFIASGGQNRLRGTNILKQFTTDGQWLNGDWRTSGSGSGTRALVDISELSLPRAERGVRVTANSFSGTIGGSVVIAQNNVPDIDAGGAYTLSCYAKGTGALVMSYGMSSQPTHAQYVNSPNEFKKYSKTFIVPTKKDGRFIGAMNKINVFFGATGAGADITICEMKLEDGITATEWSEANEDITDEITSYAESLGDQIDGKAETWYQPTDPATSWTTADERAKHDGDLWFNTANGQNTTWRYTYNASSGTGTWQQQSAPKAVFDQIDGKNTIYTGSTTPSDPQDGDLWFKGETEPILTYVVSGSSGSWKEYNRYKDNVRGADVEYYKSTSATSLSGGSWRTEAWPWEEGKYIWTRTKWTNVDGTSKYSNATCITGNTGATGSAINTAAVVLYKRGSSAPSKPSGNVTYTFSTGKATGTLDSWTQAIPSGTNPCWVIYASASSTGASDTIASSEWSTPVKFVENGTNGTNGTNGYNSRVLMLYKRAASAPSKPSTAVTYTFGSDNWSTVPSGWSKTIPATDGNPCWVSTAAAISQSASVTVAASAWSAVTKLVEDGKDGRSIASVTNYYLATDKSSGVTTSTSGWTTTVQTMTAEKQYLWNYEVVKDGDGATINTSTPCIIGRYGQNGQKGKQITSIVEYYQTSDSNSTAPTGTWSTGVVNTTTQKRYLWNYERFNYSDGTYDDTTKRVIGTHGATGKGISSVTEYYALNDSTTAPADSEFGTGVKTPTADKKYLWNYEKVTYTDNTSANLDKHIVAMYGQTGAAGKGISSITEYYALSKTTAAPADSSFSTTVKTVTSESKYLWNYEKITYTSGNPTSTAKRIIGVYGDKGTTGKGISKITELYYCGNSATKPSKPTATVTTDSKTTYNAWNKSCPTYTSTNKYYYTCSEVLYDDGTYYWTDVTSNAGLDSANSTAATASTNASNAVSTANTAQSTANTANTNANTAINTANQSKLVGTSDSSSTAQVKVVKCTQATSLTTGMRITITFANANSYCSDAVQLNVNSLGAISILSSGSVTSADNQFLWGANAIITFWYNGSHWVAEGVPGSLSGDSNAKANVASKTVSISRAVISKGVSLKCTFANENTVSYPTLNVSATGEKNILAYGETLTGTSDYNWTKNGTVDFVFDGKSWRMSDSSAAAHLAAFNNSLNQELIYNRLSKNGTLQGWWLENNKAYSSWSYLKTGTAVLGGPNNGNGILEIRNSSDVRVGRWDTNGLYLGNISGTGTTGLANANTKIDNDGKITTKNADISGKITSTSGSIGGFTIGSSKIYSGMTSLSDTANNGVYIGTDGIALGKGAFKVTSAGALTMKNGSIDLGNFKVTSTGALTAKSGTIGGWTIGSTAMWKTSAETTTSGDKQYVAYVNAPDSPTSASAAFWVREREYNGTSYGSWTDKFYARYDGYFYAVGGGRIGAWTIGTGTSGALRSGKTSLTETTNDGVWIGSDGISLGKGAFIVTKAGVLTIKSGSINLGSGNFIVSSEGSVTIKKGSIDIGSGKFSVTSAGAITATSGTIGGFTLGTSSIYKNMTSLSDTANNGVYIGTDGIALGKGNFKVTSAGALTTKSGNIGPWTIASNAIYNGMTSLTDTTHDGVWLGSNGIALGKGNFKVTSAGSITIKSGSIDIGSGAFKVTATGALTSTNATIKGTIRTVENDNGGLYMHESRIDGVKGSTVYGLIDLSAKYSDGTRKVILEAKSNELLLKASSGIKFTQFGLTAVEGPIAVKIPTSIDSSGIVSRWYDMVLRNGLLYWS